ncbi:hypothetical protein ACHAPE_003518 [Trichoderma viride]
MPWNRIYHPEGVWSQADRDAIAKGITDVYATQYPRHSTLVTFIPIAKGSFYSGGEVTTNFVRITLQHMKGSWSTYDLENSVRTKFRENFKHLIEDRGMKYELQINEIPFEEISFNGWVNNTLLGEPLFKESVEKDELVPTKRVRE